jgi:DNA end-binding protein Ku
MPVSIWKGHLRFGQVAMPVRIYRAARAEKIPFHQLAPASPNHEPIEPPGPDALDDETEPGPELLPIPDPRTGPFLVPAAPAPRTRPVATASGLSRITHRLFTQAGGRAVPRRELRKGYEYEKDRYVVIGAEELQRITPPTSREMKIVEFVALGEIDPLYLESSYYMAPDRGHEKAYALLFRALRQTGSVARAEFAMHRREHVAILRPGIHGIVLHTLYYRDQIHPEQEFRTDTSLATAQEMDLAVLLIQAMTGRFEPEKYADPYRTKLQALLAAKIPQMRKTAAPQTPGLDILQALQQSLAKARKSVGKATSSAASTSPKNKKKGRGRTRRR